MHLAVAAPPAFSWYARSVTALSGLWATTQIPGYIDSSTQYWPDDPAPGTSAPAASTVSVQALSDAELCLAWRTSSTALQRARTISQQHRILTARQEYLDELQRRDPPGFAHWLSAGARPASDPSKYLHNRDVYDSPSPSFGPDPGQGHCEFAPTSKVYDSGHEKDCR